MIARFLFGLLVASTLTLTAARAQQPTDAHLAVAREVVIGSGISRSFQTFVPEVVGQLRGTLTRARPELVKDLEESLKIVAPELEKQLDTLINNAARLYAQRLSEAELREIAAFFRTPSGQKFVSTQPQLLDEMFNEMQSFVFRMGEVATARVREEMKKRGHDL